MKKLLLLFLFVILVSLVKAQHYYPLPDSNVTWIVVQDNGYMSNIYYEYYTDTINKDTIINTKTYTKLYTTHHNLSCVYRSDTLGFTYVAGDSSHEYIIRDFTKNAGDSVYKIPSSTDAYPPSLLVDLYVDSVDYIHVGPYNLKRMFLSNHTLFPQPYSYLIWIEKIGTLTNGFYNNINAIGSGSSELYCMSYNDTVYYHDIYFSYYLGKCNNPTSIFNINNNNNISIYPNPATAQLTVEAPQNSIIEISNIQGQLLETLATTGNKTNVDVSMLAKGMYFVKVKTENEVTTQKIILNK